MTSVLAIAALIILATALVCYVFITQHIAKKKKQQARILKALKQRQQLFKIIVAELPPGYLPTELAQYVYRVLLNTCEQLAKLAPNDGHSDEFQVYSKQLETLPVQGGKVKIPTEKTESANALLRELGQYITNQAQSGSLTQASAKNLMLHLRRLLLQSSVDTYIQQAKKAQAEGKLRLTIHHYTLARKLLLKENAKQGYQKQIAQLSAIIEKYEQEYTAQNPTKKSAPEEVEKSWDKLEDDDSWKKKQIYD
ncbi:hypothetical protein [Gilvimarinus sp. 1_MG-2023]|uniref:hypothetical protein n=1 Tax=Gilvimarinus sp. 1_MG-2023 TaxID=3062638 RepID=UPI0026E28A2D|nr:hypothetical protein [Gilvimarinus sp. 1_MG-2023]MDO6747339.1 hypothetical protein [Gilvimarinus sp. 1_MG-2023]